VLKQLAYLSAFDSVVVGALQITFRAKMHVNDVFSFFKNPFWHQHIKTIQNVQIILNFSKKKNSNFLGMRVEPRSQTLPYSIRNCDSNLFWENLSWKYKLHHISKVLTFNLKSIIMIYNLWKGKNKSRSPITLCCTAIFIF